jgi:hypothetical protein
MALAIAPIAASLAGVAEPAVASLLGPTIAKNLTPMAKAGLEKLVKSKVAGKAVHKIGNALFGKKHKTARKLFKKGRSIAGVVGGQGKTLDKGLNLAGDLGMLDKNQKEAIKTGHEKAMSLHDQLSEMNKSDKSGKMNFNDDSPSPGKGTSEWDKDSGSGDWVGEYHSGGWDERGRGNTKEEVEKKLRKILQEADVDYIFKNKNQFYNVIDDIKGYLDGDKLKSGLTFNQLEKVANEFHETDLKLYKED